MISWPSEKKFQEFSSVCDFPKASFIVTRQTVFETWQDRQLWKSCNVAYFPEIVAHLTNQSSFKACWKNPQEVLFLLIRIIRITTQYLQSWSCILLIKIWDAVVQKRSFSGLRLLLLDKYQVYFHTCVLVYTIYRGVSMCLRLATCGQINYLLEPVSRKKEHVLFS